MTMKNCFKVKILNVIAKFLIETACFEYANFKIYAIKIKDNKLVTISALNDMLINKDMGSNAISTKNHL